MKNKKIVILLSFFLLLNCGYEPIYSKKTFENTYNFSITSIGFSGDNNINQNIKNNLTNFINVKSKTKKYDLTINTIKTISVTSKNKKGNPEIFYMKIILNLEIFQNDEMLSKKSFEDGFEYKNKSSKFNLKQYEESIQKNLTSKLSEEIVEYLFTIK